MRSLQRHETTSSIVERCKQVSKRALITSWMQNSPFHCKHVTYRQNLRCLSTPIRWPRPVILIRRTRSKTKKLTFSLEATKFCLVLHSTPSSRPYSNCFHPANEYGFGRKNPLAFPPNDCASLHVDFLSQEPCLDQFRSDAFLKFLFNIRLIRETEPTYCRRAQPISIK